jgi:flagellar biosynthesis anti-sigma factor FlgM
MRINSGIDGLVGIGAVRPKAEAPPVAPAKPAEAKDVFSVSSAAQLVVAARDKMADIPSVRASLIEAIKSQFDNGTYQPNPDVLVDRLLQENGPPATS